MNRAERRHRIEKIANKRFRQLYCAYHGTPEAWFYRVYDKIEQAKKIGQCKDRQYSWRCRCDYCLGGVQRKQDIADQNFRDQYDESVDIGANIKSPPPKIPDGSGVGLFDYGHELWDIFVCPWPKSWNMGNRFHHPKINFKHNGK